MVVCLGGVYQTEAELLQGFADPEGTALALSGLSVDHRTIVSNGAGGYTVTPTADHNELAHDQLQRRRRRCIDPRHLEHGVRDPERRSPKVLSRAVFRGGHLFGSSGQGAHLGLGIVSRFGFSGRDTPDPFARAAGVEPVDPFEGGELDGYDRSPWPTPMNHLGLEQAVAGNWPLRSRHGEPRGLVSTPPPGSRPAEQLSAAISHSVPPARARRSFSWALSRGMTAFYDNHRVVFI